MANIIEGVYDDGKVWFADVDLCSDIVDQKFDELYELDGQLENFNFEIATHLALLEAFEILTVHEWSLGDILKSLLEYHEELTNILNENNLEEITDGN